MRHLRRGTSGSTLRPAGAEAVGNPGTAHTGGLAEAPALQLGTEPVPVREPAPDTELEAVPPRAAESELAQRRGQQAVHSVRARYPR